jgi:hypothetical protein
MTDRTEAMDNLIAQDADLIDIGAEMAVKVTEADRDAAAHFWQKSFEGDFYTLPQAFAYHRQYGYDQGYYDGRQADGAEERAKIVAWLAREEEDYPSGKYSGFAAIIREEIEAGEHLK